MKMQTYWVLLSITSAMLCGCTTTPATPEFLSAPNTCSVLSGGSGMVFPGNAMNDRWFKINSAVSNDVGDELEARGYRISRQIVDIRDNQSRLKAVSDEMLRTKCNKVIQISNSISGESATPNVATYFEFTVNVLGVVPGSIMLKSDYQKVYRYPLTKEAMKTLSMRDVAKQIGIDLDASHVINKG
jgi:hypothetical protein